MDSKLENFSNQIVEVAGRIAGMFAFNPIVGELYALLYFSSEPVSLGDMAQRLSISKGNASVNIRALEGWGAVRKTRIKSSRKDYYVAEEDILKVIMTGLHNGLSRRLEIVTEGFTSIKTELDEVKTHLAASQKKEASFCEQRLEKLKELADVAGNLLELLERVSSNNTLDRTLKSLVEKK